METTGFPPETLEPETVSLMFAAGLTVPEWVRSPEQHSSSWLVLHGSVRFLVGTLDVGSKRGLRAIVRGIAAATEIDPSHAHAYKTPDVSAADDDQQRPWRVTFEPDDQDDRRQLTVTADDLATAIDELLEQADDGTDVIVTQQGVEVATLVGFTWYARQREHNARLSAAHWASWSAGRFDPTTYGRELAGLRTARLEPAAHPPRSGPGEGDAGAD